MQCRLKLPQASIHYLHHSSYWVAGNLEPIAGDSEHKAEYTVVRMPVYHTHTHYRHFRDANQPTTHVFELEEKTGVPGGTPRHVENMHKCTCTLDKQPYSDWIAFTIQT
ncbi:hypothetical protein QTP86_016224 [Hemibagrus guttatus]|nr:hypothetical protein QTP86_016224 [Hemibagrus guttatus]